MLFMTTKTRIRPAAWALAVVRLRIGLLPVLVFAVVGCRVLVAADGGQWDPDHAVLAYADVDAGRATIHNVRNFRWRTTDDFTVDYYDKTLSLSQLDSVDFFLCYPPKGPKFFAHAFLSFGFGESGYYLPISVEARREKGQKYSALKGMFRQFELIYVVADERDIIAGRVNARGECLYRYPIKVSRETVRDLFVDMLGTLNSLAVCPRFYHTTRNNCISNLLEHANAVSGRRLATNAQVLLAGYADRLLYKLDLVDTDVPFATLRSSACVNEAVQRYGDRPEFSTLIRRP